MLMENFLNQGLSLLFVIIGAYSILGVIFFKLWIHQKNAKLPIERKKLLRLAAQTLNDQVNDKIFDVVGYIFLAVFIITMPFALKGIAEMFASGQLNYFFIIFIAPIYSMFKNKSIAIVLFR